MFVRLDTVPELSIDSSLQNIKFTNCFHKELRSFPLRKLTKLTLIEFVTRGLWSSLG